MELKTRDEKNQGCQRPLCFLSSPKANYVHKITYQIIDVVKWRHKFVLMSIRVYKFEEL